MQPFDTRAWKLLISNPAGLAEIAPSVFFYEKENWNFLSALFMIFNLLYTSPYKPMSISFIPVLYVNIVKVLGKNNNLGIFKQFGPITV